MTRFVDPCLGKQSFIFSNRGTTIFVIRHNYWLVLLVPYVGHGIKRGGGVRGFESHPPAALCKDHCTIVNAGFLALCYPFPSLVRRIQGYALHWGHLYKPFSRGKVSSVKHVTHQVTQTLEPPNEMKASLPCNFCYGRTQLLVIYIKLFSQDKVYQHPSKYIDDLHAFPNSNNRTISYGFNNTLFLLLLCE